MSTTILANPIYQHSGETEKINPIAMQASINEDIEKRRRQLDKEGEALKMIVAKEVSHMIDETGASVHLHQAPFPAVKIVEESILTTTLKTSVSYLKASADTVTIAARGAVDTVASVATGAAESVAIAAKGAADSAVSAAKGAADTAVSAAKGAADSASYAAKGAADTAVQVSAKASEVVEHAKHDAEGIFYRAAATISHASKDAAKTLSNTAKTISHAAAEAAHKVVDTTVDVAGAVGHKTVELAEGAVNKAHEVADNISNFAAHISLLAAEEAERTRRLNESDETFAVLNALRVAELIRALGWPFYRQEHLNLNYSTKLLEEMERRHRLTSPYTSLAASNAHNLEKLVSKDMQTFRHFIPRSQLIRMHIHSIENKERTRRLNDPDEAFAILNAFAVRDLFRQLGWPGYRQECCFDKCHAAYGTTLLEEIERKDRIRSHNLPHSEDSSHQLMDVVAHNINKFNFNSRQASHFVNEFASKLGNATTQVTAAFSEKTKEFAQSTLQRVQAVAGDISHFSTLMYVLALEEREKVRRLNDPDEVLAITNAWEQAALIRQLEGFWRVRTHVVFPARYLEEIERRWRLNHDDRETIARARAVAALVASNLGKFEAAVNRFAQAQKVASHSRLNPKAAPFVPVSVKPDPFITKTAPIRSNVASGAQL